MAMIIPHVEISSWWRALLLGDANLTFTDAARTQYYDHWPDSYKSFTRLARTNVSIFRVYTEWVINEYAPKFRGFQPLEIAKALHNSSGKDDAKAVTLMRSRMCHDFVTDSLWVLYENGVQLGAEEPILRDHIIMYAEEATNMGKLPSSGRKVRQWLRYLRLLALYLEEIKQEFTAGRAALIINWRLGLPVFLHDASGEYEAKLVPPFLNYCYLPLALPPEVHDPMGAMKLCALGMEANMTNGTVPFPWGAELAVEEHLDKDMVLPSLLLVALVAALGPNLVGSDSNQPAAASAGASKKTQ
jgi:hypothetical protein